MIVIIINYIFCPNIIYFCSVKLVIRNPASKSLQSTEISLYLAFMNELNVAQKEKNIDQWLILPKNIILLMKSQLVTNYTLKHDVNRCEWVSECCSKQIQQIFSYIMARTSYFSMRWWWRSLCSIRTRWVGFLYC